MVYGTNPRNGFFRDGLFCTPICVSRSVSGTVAAPEPRADGDGGEPAAERRDPADARRRRHPRCRRSALPAPAGNPGGSDLPRQRSVGSRRSSPPSGRRRSSRCYKGSSRSSRTMAASIRSSATRRSGFTVRTIRSSSRASAASRRLTDPQVLNDPAQPPRDRSDAGDTHSGSVPPALSVGDPDRRARDPEPGSGSGVRPGGGNDDEEGRRRQLKASLSEAATPSACRRSRPTRRRPDERGPSIRPKPNGGAPRRSTAGTRW
jgi:hypothetical protein